MEISEKNPNPYSILSFLKKVFKQEEVGNIESDFKLLIIAVHAVFLESGFVAFDSNKNKKINGFHFLEGWESKSSKIYVHYTIPDLLDYSYCSNETVKTVCLMFQKNSGKFLIVHGSLIQNCNKEFYTVCMENTHVVPAINSVVLNGDSMISMDFKYGSSSNSKSVFRSGNGKRKSNGLDSDELRETECERYKRGKFISMIKTNDPMKAGVLNFISSLNEKRIFEFWKIIKDELAFPLLIDLCEKTGLPPPPCFMSLPTDLKLKILQLLSDDDVIKIGCVASELRTLPLIIISKERREERRLSVDILPPQHRGVGWKFSWLWSWNE